MSCRPPWPRAAVYPCGCIKLTTGHWPKSSASRNTRGSVSSTYTMSIVSSVQQPRHSLFQYGKCTQLLLTPHLVNKRLDEWVTEEDLDTRKVQFPRRDGTQTGASTGVTTPKRHVPSASASSGGVGSAVAGSYGSVSRPNSPQPAATAANSEVVNGNTVLAAALQKRINRKRKVKLAAWQQ